MTEWPKVPDSLRSSASPPMLGALTFFQSA
jgi:hypothetical protein